MKVAIEGSLQEHQVQLEKTVDDSAQGMSWLAVSMEEERRSKCIWVGISAVHGESSEPGNTARGLQTEGKLSIQVETHLSLKAPQKTQ